MIRDERFERWLESRRLAWAIQRETRLRYPHTRLLRGDSASAVTLAPPNIAAFGTTSASTSIQVLPGGVSVLWPGSGTNASPRAGFWQEGKTVELEMFGIGTTSTSPGSTVFQWNVATSQNVTTGNSLGSSTIALVASQTNITWIFQGRVTCTATGTAGALLAYGWLGLGALSTAAGSPYLVPLSGARTTAAIDTTQSSAINFLVTLGATTVTLTVEQAYWKTPN